MDQIIAVFDGVSRWLGIPDDITLWELLNSELIAALIIGLFGLFLGRKVNRLSEKAEDTATAAAYERELADLEVAEPQPLPDESAVEPPATPMPSRKASAPAAPGSDSMPVGGLPDLAEDTIPERNPLQSDASHIVSRAKKYVDEQLDAQKDGRKRRRYENIGKRDYRMRVLAARDDDLISEAQAANLLDVFETWRPFGTGRRVVTQDVLDHLEGRLREAQAEKSRPRRRSRGAD